MYAANSINRIVYCGIINAIVKTIKWFIVLDIKLLRANPKAIKTELEKKGFDLDIEYFKKLEADRKFLQVEVEKNQNIRNTKSKEIGILKAKGGDASNLLKEEENAKAELQSLEERLSAIQTAMDDFLLHIPNIPQPSVPVGKDEHANPVVREVGNIRKWSFAPKDHIDLEICKKLIPLEVASKLSGSRFTLLKGDVAKLHRIIGQFMISLHADKYGYEEVYTPYLVKSDCLIGTGQLPKFKEDQFAIEGRDLWLIPTSEVSVTNIVRESILNNNQLPMKFTCHSPCFRSEAGSYGKDTKGMFRHHQFDKVELVHITTADKSAETLEQLLSHAESVLQILELPYRVVERCTGDLGFTAEKGYDIEVWLPGQNQYREISSCSSFGAFQARRMQARYKDENNKTQHVHTLNGSGLAIGRTLIAIIENYQNEDGSITIPKALQTLMGVEKISA